MSVLFLDCETRRPFPSPNIPSGIEVARNKWDFTGMGVSVVLAYADWRGQFYCFYQENLNELWRMAKEAKTAVGFNYIRFDERLLAAHGCNFRAHRHLEIYDLQMELRAAAGQDLVRTKGDGLDDMARINLGFEKPVRQVFAPVLWQIGETQQLVDLCFSNVLSIYHLYTRRRELWYKSRGADRIDSPLRRIHLPAAPSLTRDDVMRADREGSSNVHTNKG